MDAITGGCLCGSLRYAVAAGPTNPHFCTCRQCQRWSGAPAVAWVDVPAAALRFDGPGGAPSWFRSSDIGERAFCRQCGGSVAARLDGADEIGLTIASLDEPDRFVPVRQSFPESAPSWLRLGGLPATGA